MKILKILLTVAIGVFIGAAVERQVFLARYVTPFNFPLADPPVAYILKRYSNTNYHVHVALSPSKNCPFPICYNLP